MKKLIIGFLILFVISLGIQFSHEESYVVQVIKITTQQNINHDGNNNVSSSYRYLVTTDKGVFEISPDGLFACQEFGSLVEGEKYLIHTRGISCPIMGVFSYIIKAENN